jgi:hypothetical protein
MIKFILLCYLPFGNAGELTILCCQGFEVKYYDFTLDALNLKPSDVCNVGVTSYPKRGNNVTPGTGHEAANMAQYNILVFSYSYSTPGSSDGSISIAIKIPGVMVSY